MAHDAAAVTFVNDYSPDVFQYAKMIETAACDLLDMLLY